MINPINWYYKKIAKLNSKSYEWGLKHKNSIIDTTNNMLIIISSVLDLFSLIVILVLFVANILTTKYNILTRIILAIPFSHIFIVLLDYSKERISYTLKVFKIGKKN